MKLHYAGFNNCFRRAQGTFVAGEARLRFVVAKTGRVDHVWVVQSDLGSWEVEDCLVQAARFLEFPRPDGDARARFDFPFRWNTPNRRLSLGVDANWGYATLREHRQGLWQCRRNHGYEQAFTMTMYVGRKGQVLASGVASEEPASDTFAGCMVELLRGVKFPNPGSRIVKYVTLVENLPAERLFNPRR